MKIKILKTVLLSFFFTLLLITTVLAETKVTVLPFEISIKKLNQEQFTLSFAISDTLNEALSYVEEFSVVDNSSIQTFIKEKKITTKEELINTLKLKTIDLVDLTILGSVTEENNTYIANFTIINNKTDKEIKSIKLKSNDLFDLNKQIFFEILKNQKIVIEDIPKYRVIKFFSSTNDLRAYFNFAKGKEQYNLFTTEGFKEAKKYFEKAISYDQNYNLAYSYNLEALTLIALYSKFEENFNQVFLARAEEYLESLKNKDINNNAFYRAKTIIQLLKNQDELALEEIKNALEISYNDYLANYLFLFAKNKKDKTLTFFNKPFKTVIDKNPYITLPNLHQAYLFQSEDIKEEALKEYLKLEARMTSSVTLYNNIAKIYIQKNEPKIAFEYLQKALKSFNNNATTYFRLAEYYQLNKDFDKAINNYKYAMNINSDSPTLNFFLGLTYHAKGELKTALKYYKKAIELDPNDARFYSGIGQIAYRENRLEDAVIAYTRALEINPTLAYPHVNLGVVYQKQGKQAEALEKIKEGLKIKEEYPYAYYNLGVIYEAQKNYEDAINAYNKALKYDRGYFLAYNKLGLIYQEQGKLDEALKEFSKVITLEPSYTNAYFNIGKIHQAKKNFSEAIKAYKLAQKVNPDLKTVSKEMAGVYLQMGIELYNRNKVFEAINSYEESIKIKPNDEKVYNNLGVAYFKLNKNDKAIIEFKKAILANPQYADAYDNLGIAYHKIGKIKEALVQYDKACNLGKKESCEMLGKP